jgi:hypothetical protein
MRLVVPNVQIQAVPTAPGRGRASDSNKAVPRPRAACTRLSRRGIHSNPTTRTKNAEAESATQYRTPLPGLSLFTARRVCPVERSRCCRGIFMPALRLALERRLLLTCSPHPRCADAPAMASLAATRDGAQLGGVDPAGRPRGDGPSREWTATCSPRSAAPHTSDGPNFPLLSCYFRTDEPPDVGVTRSMEFTRTPFPSPGAALIGDQLACRVSELFNASTAPCCYYCSYAVLHGADRPAQAAHGGPSRGPGGRMDQDSP